MITISGGLKEDGIVIGNVYDKYGSRNPLVRWIMRGFDEVLSGLVTQVAPRTIHEIGCGEGFWVLNWNRQGIAARGSDFSNRVIGLARANAVEEGFSPEIFKTLSIYDLASGQDSADLMVCCEVLEHLAHPDNALQALQRAATNFVIISVPREPIWRILNMARGKYLADCGNTHGHIKHWSCKGLVQLVERYFAVEDVLAPIPWTMLLCRVRR